jgi:MinD-like ATPase involved in chromosome partitioning or flagellar assembly
MNKINLAILMTDTSYMNLFTNYIRTSEYADTFTVRSFSQPEMFEQHVQRNRVHVLLAQRELMPARNLLNKGDTVIVLDENYHGDEEKNYPFVPMYQPLDKLILQVLLIHSEDSYGPIGLLRKSGATSVISVFSASGGSGKSTVAMNMAHQLALLDKKIFYLNLELAGSLEPVFETVNYADFGQLIYCLKSEPQQLRNKLEPFLKYQARLNVEYLCGPYYSQEMQELAADDIGLLISELAAMARYDFIVVDLESTRHPRITAALKSSDRVIWIVTDDIRCLHKTHLWAEDLKFLDLRMGGSAKTAYVLNKYIGTPLNDFKAKGIEITAYLPYVPDWKSLQQAERLFSDSGFNEHILRLYKAMGLEEEGIGTGPGKGNTGYS